MLLLEMAITEPGRVGSLTHVHMLLYTIISWTWLSDSASAANIISFYSLISMIKNMT